MKEKKGFAESIVFWVIVAIIGLVLALTIILVLKQRGYSIIDWINNLRRFGGR